MKSIDEIREDVEIEMAKEFASCGGNVYAENEALWLALRDERVTKCCIVSDIVPQNLYAKRKESFRTKRLKFLTKCSDYRDNQGEK